MRRTLVLAANLLLGGVVLGWVLHRFGASALEILGSGPSLPLLATFVATLAASLLVLVWRWRMLLRGIGSHCSLLALALFRSAGHSVAVLVPSGKLGGDPLRAWLAARAGIPASHAIASVAIDRALEFGAAAPFSILFATVLVRSGVPELASALATVTVAAVGLALGLVLAARRLRSGRGLATALAGTTRLDRLAVVQDRMEVIVASESAATRLIEDRRLLLGAFAVGLVGNLLVIAEFALLLEAFGLPATPTAVCAAIFVTGAAHMLPVPAGVGVLEGAQMWIFGMLGYPPDVGLAVGLAVRLRELLWTLPGLLYLLARLVTRATK